MIQPTDQHAIPASPSSEYTQAGKRYLFLDVETTGISTENGDRIVEFAALEMIDRKLTGNQLHLYINPQRPVGETVHIHGISDDFLQDKPVFADIATQIIDFIEGAGLIAHNASFDTRFLDAELRRVALPLVSERLEVIDTLAIARQKHPAQKNNLDALAKRYTVTERDRTFHGALLDTQILADVFLAMTGGQVSLLADPGRTRESLANHALLDIQLTQQLVIITANSDECAQHRQWVEDHGNAEKNPEALWHHLQAVAHSDSSNHMQADTITSTQKITE